MKEASSYLGMNFHSYVNAVDPKVQTVLNLFLGAGKRESMEYSFLAPSIWKMLKE